MKKQSYVLFNFNTEFEQPSQCCIDFWIGSKSSVFECRSPENDGYRGRINRDIYFQTLSFNE